MFTGRTPNSSKVLLNNWELLNIILTEHWQIVTMRICNLDKAGWFCWNGCESIVGQVPFQGKRGNVVESAVLGISNDDFHL